jgi:hypothetical protein
MFESVSLSSRYQFQYFQPTISNITKNINFSHPDVETSNRQGSDISDISDISNISDISDIGDIGDIGETIPLINQDNDISSNLESEEPTRPYNVDNSNMLFDSKFISYNISTKNLKRELSSSISKHIEKKPKFNINNLSHSVSNNTINNDINNNTEEFHEEITKSPYI